MRRLTERLAAAGLMALLMLGGANAHPPPELADFVGAKAGQAEGGLNNLGYQNSGGSYWYNASEGVCVHMPVSQGRFKSVDIVKPANCGISIRSGDTGPGAGCPADVSQADRYLYPDCDAPAATPAAAAPSGDFSDVSNAAVDACNKSADDYQGVAPGTSSPTGVTKSGANWVLTMSSGGTYVSTCTVTAAGKVVNMAPGG